MDSSGIIKSGINIKNMKQIILLIVGIMLLFSAKGQVTDFESFKQQKEQKFAEYKDSKQKEWAAYRARLNGEYADKMRQSWKSYNSMAAIPEPKRPEPPRPVVKTNQDPAPTKTMAYSKYIPAVAYKMPQPVVPIAHAANESEAGYVFEFYSTPCKVHLQRNMAFSLPDISEAYVSDAWRNLSVSNYDVVADDCLNIREQLDLNDWGYIELVKCLSRSFFGGETNEAVLMRTYLLVQSGYRVRLGRSDNRLMLLVPFANIIYRRNYLYMDGERYYILEDDLKGGNYSVFNEKFTGEKTASLYINRIPRFFDEPVRKKTFTAEWYKDASASIVTNRNLIDFYNTYPLTYEWDNYVRASLSQKVKRLLYPVLKRQIEGKSEEAAVNLLLNFVQTAFEYKVDHEQFGCERPLFGDEIFFYPFSDCEDRSILFAILVRELLHLEVVLLDLPGHLATAVNFNEDVGGYCYEVKGKRYVVCDPTYIYASAGHCMPQFVDVAAKIVEIGN